MDRDVWCLDHARETVHAVGYPTLVGGCRNLLDYYQSGVPALVTVICDTSVNVVYAIHGYVVRVDSNPRLFLHRFQTVFNQLL